MSGTQRSTPSLGQCPAFNITRELWDPSCLQAAINMVYLQEMMCCADPGVEICTWVGLYPVAAPCVLCRRVSQDALQTGRHSKPAAERVQTTAQPLYLSARKGEEGKGKVKEKTTICKLLLSLRSYGGYFYSYYLTLTTIWGSNSL